MGKIDALIQALSQMPNEELAGWIMVWFGGIAVAFSALALYGLHMHR